MIMCFDSWFVNRVILCLVTLILGGCGLPEIEPLESGLTDDNEVSVRFDVGSVSLGKSSVSPDEDVIDNLNLYAYCNGILVASGYFEQSSGLSLKLLYSHSYSLYALANVGRYQAPFDEEDFLNECVLDMESISDIEERLPMAWHMEEFVVSSLSERVHIRFDRLVSKVLFGIDKSALDGLSINGARMCQSPRRIWPFRWKDGSRAMDESDVFDGDYASSEDLEELNSGGRVCFYVPENCQGLLLEGNDDPWAKVPENIPGREDVCTYLEVDCTFDDGGFYSGDVQYRMYLGKDSISDFNVMRNSVMDVSLFLTDSGLGKVSWRVDADVSVNDGYARGWVSRGLHPINNLYMGERFVYTLELAQEMVDYFDGVYDDIRLCSCAYDGDGKERIIFGIPSFSGMAKGRYRFDVEGLCRTFGTGDVCLADKDGNTIVSVGEFVVGKPRLLVSDEKVVSSGIRVSGVGGAMLLDVNGQEREVYLYMVDSDCFNLNSSAGVGFDFSQFDFVACYDSICEKVCEALHLRMLEGTQNDDGPFLICSLTSRNDGGSDELNRNLLEFWSDGAVGSVLLADAKSEISQEVEFGLQYLPITLTLVDNGWAGYADCQISMKVDNPSNFPVMGQCWQLNKVKDSYNAIARNEITDLYGVEFTRQTYEYVCGDFPSGEMPLYCSGSSFSASGSCVCHLPEISTQAMLNAALYDYMSQHKLYHHIDAVFENGKPIYDLKVVDNLSDGSKQYDVIYGNDPDMDGWDDRGIWLYSGGICISKPATDFDLLSGVNPISLSALAAGETGGIKISYDAGKGGFTACANSAQSVGLQLNAEITIKASGYVSTTPNGTMFGSEDNYCSSNVSKKVSNVILGLTPVEIDGGAVKSALNAIYSQTFYDSYNLIGSSNNYAHHAHPTSIEVSMKFSLSGDSAGKMVVLSLTAPSSVSFYHSQESVTYSVAMKTTKQTNKVGIVQNLKK